MSNWKFPLEIYKDLGPLLSSITVAVNTRADNHFHKYIYLFQILHSMKSDVKVLIFEFNLDVKHRPYVF